MIRQDCMMYVAEHNKCNGLTEMKCTTCRFYKPVRQLEKELYIASMKEKGLYFKPAKKRNKAKPKIKKEKGEEKIC